MADDHADRQNGCCQCGAVRFTCPAEPLALYVCHCRDCQRQSSSAFGISFIVPRDRVELLQGEPAAFARATDSGGELECVFCPSCGVRLWHIPGGTARNMSIKGGTLDRSVSLADAMHIWTDRKLDGLVLPPGVESWPKEPDG